jgi:hypothetical protein
MGAVKAIDKKINSYLGQLNENQKKAVLTVVKTFADEKATYDYWEDESFVKELEKRTAEYESGKAEVYTLAEMEAGARKAYKANKKSNK